MFDTPVDAWYVWLGVAVASLAVFGVVTSFPTTPAPDARAVAETVDTVATSEYDTTASHTLDARWTRLGPRGIGLRNDAGTAHATFGYPVVPVPEDTRLDRVVHGAPPTAVFSSPRGFEQAVETARSPEPTWRPAGQYLLVRHVSWEGVDVTLVGTADTLPRDV